MSKPEDALAVGSSDTFDRAIATFSDSYANQNQRDFDVAAARSGFLDANESTPR